MSSIAGTSSTTGISSIAGTSSTTGISSITGVASIFGISSAIVLYIIACASSLLKFSFVDTDSSIISGTDTESRRSDIAEISVKLSSEFASLTLIEIFSKSDIYYPLFLFNVKTHKCYLDFTTIVGDFQGKIGLYSYFLCDF